MLHLTQNETIGIPVLKSWRPWLFRVKCCRVQKDNKMVRQRRSKLLTNKTGARQYTRTVFSMFAEIHSTHPISAYIFFSLLLLGSHPSSLMHYLGFILLEFPVGICDALHITSMIAISSLDFLLLSCLHVRLRNALLNHEVHELDGYN